METIPPPQSSLLSQLTPEQLQQAQEHWKLIKTQAQILMPLLRPILPQIAAQAQEIAQAIQSLGATLSPLVLFTNSDSKPLEFSHLLGTPLPHVKQTDELGPVLLVVDYHSAGAAPERIVCFRKPLTLSSFVEILKLQSDSDAESVSTWKVLEKTVPLC